MKKHYKNNKLLIIFALFIMIVVFPIIAKILLKNSNYIIKISVFILIYIIAVSGLDILYGYCGQISMGHAGFFAIGAYGSALINDFLNIPILLSILLAALISILIAIIVAYPAANLKFHFLSLATIAFGEVVYTFIQASPNEITGNFKGFFPKSIELFNINFSKEYIAFYYFVLILVVMLLLIKRNLVNSKIGRGFIAIRENPIAANGMGINVRKYKIMAFAISAFYVSISGSLYAHFVNYISPGLFSYEQSVSFIVMLLLGGSGSMVGPIIGVISIQTFNELLRSFDKYQMFIYGVLILLVVLFMPNGMLGLVKQIKNKVRKHDIRS